MPSSDQQLRELQRAFDATLDLALLDPLLEGYRRVGLMPPARVLARRPRWRPLAEFVETFYEEPLSEESGCSEAEIQATEQRLGVRLPCALREWYFLVGHRLRDVGQDVPTSLSQLRVEDDAVTVWIENQGVWSVSVSANGTQEDPAVRVDEDFASMGPLSEALRGLLLSDTLTGASKGQGLGPLGALAPAVTGGWHESIADWEGARARYPARAEPPIPTFAGHPYRGNREVVLRAEDGGTFLLWAAATEPARQELLPYLVGPLS